jgi:hypothetical protein
MKTFWRRVLDLEAARVRERGSLGQVLWRVAITSWGFGLLLVGESCCTCVVGVLLFVCDILLLLSCAVRKQESMQLVDRLSSCLMLWT